MCPDNIVPAGRCSVPLVSPRRTPCAGRLLQSDVHIGMRARHFYSNFMRGKFNAALAEDAGHSNVFLLPQNDGLLAVREGHGEHLHFGPGKNRRELRRQNANNGNNYHQLDHGESSPAAVNLIEPCPSTTDSEITCSHCHDIMGA